MGHKTCRKKQDQIVVLMSKFGKMKASLPDVDLDEGGTTLRRLVGALSITEELIDFLRPPGGTISFLVIPSSWILQSTIFTRKDHVKDICQRFVLFLCLFLFVHLCYISKNDGLKQRC